MLLRFLGQLMIAKRNMEEERALNERQRKAEKERENKLKNFGRITILGGSSSRKKSEPQTGKVEDVDFEEIQ